MDALQEAARIEKYGARTERDIAISIEIGRQVYSMLEDLERTIEISETKPEILLEGKRVRFGSWDDVYAFLAGVMYR